jgi:threonine dehydratase
MLHEDSSVPPTIDDVRKLRQRLRRWLIETPVLHCRNLEYYLADGAEIWGKLEFLQQTGTFKPRGALSVMLSLNDEQRAAGITAVSAGNHAIAASFAARAVGASAKVVMIRSASPVRIEACRSFGAEIVLADDVHDAFEMVEQIREKEGRYFVHPFEGPKVAAGTATVGLEICEQIGDFDALVVPIGGGGLCAGISSAVKQLNPDCEIIGVEPEGADSMHQSFASGQAEKIDRVSTIADSLGAPFAMPYSFDLCRQNVDELVMISDDDMRQAMGVLFSEMKFAVEPACAASTAAIAGPLRGRYSGKKVVLVFCGSNIDWETYQSLAVLNSC